MKCRIKKGAMVGQDFSQFRWGDDQTIFTASDAPINGRRKCIADGYGSFLEGEEYGSGAVYVQDCDLVPVNSVAKGEDEMIKVNVTPKELACCFWDMVSEDQALFFNELGAIAGTCTGDFSSQLEAVSRDDGLTSLTPAGRRVMETIGEYSQRTG